MAQLNPSSQPSSAVSRRWIFLLVLLTFSLFFFRLGSWAFFDADEGRYGSIPREMAESGDFITPTLNQIKFFDKPPLLYWGIAASYKLFGFSEAAARLIPALAALMGVVFAWQLGRRMFSERTGLLAAVILSTSLMWPLLARVVITDMLVSSLLFISLAVWWMAHTQTIPKRRLTFYAAFWAVMALAVLSKGPVNLVLAGGAIVLYCALARQWSALKATFQPVGLAVFFAVAAPWFIAVALHNPEFNHYFWYDQHIARFFGESISGADHIRGIDYFIKLIPVILFPWSVFIPVAIFAAVKAWKQPDTPRRRAGVFLLSIVIFILAFYSTSSSKLITYLLPILPPIAILLAAYFDRLLNSERLGTTPMRAPANSILVLGVLILVGAVAAGWKGAPKALELGVSQTLINICCAVLVLWGLALLAAAARRRTDELLAATAGGFTAMFVAALFMISSVAPQFTTPALIAYIQPGIRAGAEVDTLPFIQSVVFYSGERVEMLGLPSELEFGINQLPTDERREWVTQGDLYNTELKHLLTDLQLSTPVYFVVRKNDRTELILKQMPQPAIRIIENERFVVIANEAAAKLTPPKPTQQS